MIDMGENKMETENEMFGIVYRLGSENASDTAYFICGDRVLSIEEKYKAGLNFVRRYDDLSGEQFDKIGRLVEQYKGPEKGLLKKIKDEVLK